MDALSTGVWARGFALYYSVSQGSRGLAGAPANYYRSVADQTAKGQAGGAIFRREIFNPLRNQLIMNQHTLGILPGLWANAPNPGFPQDDVDALDMMQAQSTVFFSLGTNTLGFGRADVLYNTAARPAVFQTAAQLGLLPGDDIDALQIVGNGDILFSLRSGSPSLAVIPSASAAAILRKPTNGPPALFIPAQTLGLRNADELDAIAFADFVNLAGTDLDADWIPDSIDNCVGLQNPLQEDAEGDGCSNQCDVDLDGSGLYGLSDLFFYGAVCNGGIGGPECDFNVNGTGGDPGDRAIIVGTPLGTPPGPGIAGICP